MILADKIVDLRKKNGWSQEELAEKLEVSRQSVSKWESAQSTPDMKRILMMSELFGVSTDYLLKDNVEAPDSENSPAVENAGDTLPVKKVTMQEANDFLGYINKKSNRMAIGVLLCIISSVPLILLCENDMGVRLGLIVLFLMIAGAVALFVLDGLAGDSYKDYVSQVLDTEYDVPGLVRERREKYRATHAGLLACGILLCVASVVPLLLFAKPDEEGLSLNSGYPLAAVLIMVGVGVLCIVKSNIIWGGYQILLEEDAYSREAKAEAHSNRFVSSIYWTVATVIYLLWSFVTFDWGTTWIVWPIAGVAYGLLEAILRIIRKRG